MGTQEASPKDARWRRLAPDTDVLYLMGERYYPGLGRGVRWGDPAVGISWPVSPEVLSDRDGSYPDYDAGLSASRRPLSKRYQDTPLSPTGPATTVSPVQIGGASGKLTLGTLVAAILASLLIMVPSAAANPNDVILDYRADGVIDGEHAPGDIYDAMGRWKATGTPNYGSFEEAAVDALDQITLGISPSRPTPPADGEQRASEVIPEAAAPATGLALPTPPAQGESRPPLAFLALSALAALLVLAGAGAAVTRRLRSGGS